MSDKVVVGSIAGAFGVRGEVRIKSYCADPSAIADYNPLTLENGRVLTLTLLRPVKGGYAVRLSGVATKEEADALRGAELLTERERLPSLPDDEYYHADLIGLSVLDTGGEELGHVKSVQNNGADDLLEVHGPGLSTTVFVPFTKAVVPTIDLTARRIVIDPPEGLF
ncbi:16S rRNA processing protein RimM [Poseidonocella pacifica]|uniref:Ribosome maturation factor RimM n=1 Tax=Poseidonocella pacifica TaxID=871651 RepID=A0A1I0Y1S4_9RHOB|nr:ribosome maturation factor RimM [Poseidonocella pacifica]SFB07172.1 16S rRNA processing protein RimM [Poseidonocella pacifica]